jgi:predicted PurR-regulated permease PerM
MSNDQNFEEKVRARKLRRKIFNLIFGTLVLISGGFLIWKLSILILPIIVGALMAFLFRAVKDRFELRWLPHYLIRAC